MTSPSDKKGSYADYLAGVVGESFKSAQKELWSTSSGAPTSTYSKPTVVDEDKDLASDGIAWCMANPKQLAKFPDSYIAVDPVKGRIEYAAKLLPDLDTQLMGLGKSKQDRLFVVHTGEFKATLGE